MKEDVLSKFGKINVEIEGVSSLLMHNIAGADLEKTAKRKIKTYDPKEECEKAAYWMNNGDGKRELCVPARCIYAMLLNAAKPFRMGKSSVASLIAGAIRVEPIDVSLGTDKYEIDIQSVVIQNNRIRRARPRLDAWKLNFDLIYHKDYVEPTVLEKIVTEGGFKVGLLDYRPQRRGPYGTFQVTKFEVIN